MGVESEFCSGAVPKDGEGVATGDVAASDGEGVATGDEAASDVAGATAVRSANDRIDYIARKYRRASGEHQKLGGEQKPREKFCYMRNYAKHLGSIFLLFG